MTREELSKLLSSPYHLTKGMELKRERLIRLRSMAEKATGTMKAIAVSGGGGRSKVEDNTIAYLELADEIEADMKKMAEDSRKIASLIALVDGPRTRNVMEAYHLNRMSRDAIATRLYLSIATVDRDLRAGREEILRKVGEDEQT